MNLQEWLDVDLQELEALVRQVDDAEVRDLCDQILAARRIFVVGKGRSGLVMQMFAMRLMQMGLTAFVVGDSTTPAIQERDLLIAGSGSGETASVVSSVEKALEVKARSVAITSRADSTLGKKAHSCLILPGETTKLNINPKSKIPLGSVIEQALLVTLDCVSVWLASELNQTNQTMMDRHTNLE